MKINIIGGFIMDNNTIQITMGMYRSLVAVAFTGAVTMELVLIFGVWTFVKKRKHY